MRYLHMYLPYIHMSDMMGRSLVEQTPLGVCTSLWFESSVVTAYIPGMQHVGRDFFLFGGTQVPTHGSTLGR